MVMDLNLNLLRAYYHVAETRSFSEAARRLHVSQPAVSKAVRELENQLELPLLDRGPAGLKSKRGIQLTDNGQALYEHARAIYSLERSAVDDIQARLGLQRGRLTVGASTTIAGYWLPRAVAQFLHSHAHIELHVVTGNTQTIYEALLDGRVDVALVEGSITDPRIDTRPWREDRLQIVAHPENPITQTKRVTAAQLSRQTWLQREQGSGTREIMDSALQRLGVTPRHRVDFASNEGIARTIAAGTGIALLPALVVDELLHLRQIVTLATPGGQPLTRPLYHLQLKQRPLSPLVRAFDEALEKIPVPAPQ